MALTDRTQLFLDKAHAVHGSRYSYEPATYVNAHTKIPITCVKHGVFMQSPANHGKGVGCPSCKGDTLSRHFSGTKATWLANVPATHKAKYDYSKGVYAGVDTPIEIVCKLHGSFFQTPWNHQIGKGCNTCRHQTTATKNADTVKTFTAKARKVHGDSYDYSDTCYAGTKTNLTINCPTHGAFKQTPSNHIKGTRCPTCATTTPFCELEIAEFLDSLGVKYIAHDRSAIAPQELDFYLPAYNLAIEHCGLYWHSEDKLGIQYHKRKREAAAAKGIHLIQIFEDEWANRRDAVKTLIRGAVGAVPRIYARKCSVTVETPVLSETRDFVEANHHAGSTTARTAVVMRYEGVIVYAATFRRYSADRKQYLPTEWELARVTSTVRVVGGLSRVIAAFKRDNDCTKLVSFCDLRYFEGKGYDALGFNLIHATQPTPYYANNRGSRKHQRSYTKSKTIALFGSQHKTAKAAMLANGFWRIFDAGHLKYVLQ